MKYDMITVGGNTVDAFARTQYSELISIMDPKGERDFLAYPSGSKILIKELNFTTGGGGTNTAVALSRLGHKIAYLGKMGNDENAEFIINSLKKEKIDLIVVKGKGQSGYSMILDSLKHDRTILTFKGCNNELKFSEIPLKKMKSKWFYFSSLMNESFKTLEKLSVYAQKNGIKVAFNASSYLAEKGSSFLGLILRNTDILVLNKQEAELIVGRDNIESNLKKLSKLGPKIVVITNGSKGVYCFDNKNVYSSSPPKIEVVETTGAGDAFASTFLSGIVRGKGIEFAIKMGITNACSVISHNGAKEKLLNFKELLKDMKKYNIKIVKKKA